MWPWLIGGAIALYIYNRSQSGSGSVLAASNGTTVTLPGLNIAPALQPLTSDDVAVARSVLDGSYVLPGTTRRIDSIVDGATAAQRLTALQSVFDSWAQVGRSSNAPDLRTVLALG